MSNALIPITYLENYAGNTPLKSAKNGDAGIDLYASFPFKASHMLPPGARILVPCGVKIALLPGMVGMVCPRSGLALKSGIMVLNAPGIIDSGYRGEVGVILHNASDTPYQIDNGDRVAQLVMMLFQPVTWASYAPEAFASEHEKTERAGGGFGSSGT